MIRIEFVDPGAFVVLSYRGDGGYAPDDTVRNELRTRVCVCTSFVEVFEELIWF